tara:strand:+ start:51 stop:857 length:807 start_codon:yes stop_codon:yes gene_type:complete
MSIVNHNFGTNRVGGSGIGSKNGQSIYDESSTARYAIGEKLELADGRVFRYGVSAAAIKAGLLAAPDVSATSLAYEANIVIAAANGFSPAAGSTQLQITKGSIEENQYAGGYLQIATTLDAGVGEGIQYRIKSNSATAETTAGKVDIYLFDPIKVTLTTASDIIISGNAYNKLITATTTDTLCAGVTPIAFTSGYYGWYQTAGIATVLMESNGAGVPVVGDNLTLGDGVAGSVQLKLAGTETEPFVGICAQTGSAGDFVSVMLRLGEV